MNGKAIAADPDSIFAVVDPDTGRQRIFHITQANRLLVRKDLVPKSDLLFGDDSHVAPSSNEAHQRAGEHLLQSMQERCDTNWCEVLAVGPKRPYTDAERATYCAKDSRGNPIKLPKGWRVVFDVKPGDHVCVPEMVANPHFGAVTGCQYDFFVHEGDCLLGVSAEEYAAMTASKREVNHARN